MCNAQAIMSIAQGVTGTASGIIGMKAQGDKSDYDIKQSTQNATMAETGARDATARGQQAQASSDLKYGALAGRQRSALAASGTDVQSGSALDLLGDTRLMSDLDAQTIRNNAAREAFGYKAVAGQFKGQTDVLRQKAPYQTASSILGIATGAGGSMMQAWSDSKN